MDLDLLVTREGLERVHERLIGLGYRPKFPGARKKIVDTVRNVPIELIQTGEFPGDGKPKPVAFPDPATVAEDRGGLRIANLPTLVTLKLASGMTSPVRVGDLADVLALIAANGLDERFAEVLHPWVREKYLELCAAVRAGGDERE